MLILKHRNLDKFGRWKTQNCPSDHQTGFWLVLIAINMLIAN